MDKVTLSYINIIITIITGIIAYLIYRLDRHRQKEIWIKEYRDIHETFWNDPVMARVRYWINYDRAYLEIKPILQKRQEIVKGKIPQEELLESEYKCLDDLDKFYNLVLEVAALNKHLRRNFEQDFWTSLYFKYWVSDAKPISEGKRTELEWYLCEFYGNLLKMLDSTSIIEKCRKLEEERARHTGAENEKIGYRFAADSDLDLLAEWNHQLIRDEGHRNSMTVLELRERMRGFLAGEYKAVIFWIETEPAAYALYRESADEIYLRQLFVARDHRRQGIGKMAVEILHGQLWPRTKRLTVEVLTANAAAVNFWRAVGYQDYSLTLEIMPKEK